MSRVLFVDDDARLLASMRRSLGRRFDLATAQGGEAALALMAAEGPFAVVVSDVMMPGMDGIEFLSRVAEQYPETVRIALTGHASLQVVMDAANSGHVYRFLTKPCPVDLLKRALEDGLAQYGLMQARAENMMLRQAGKVMEGIIQGFTTIVEARDPYTAGHQKRVAALSLQVGKALGLPEERLFALRMAALVHDIGKVYVPAEFLNKPGRLSSQEFAIVKIHPSIGADILKPVEFSWNISQIVLQHHERMDGQGYPQGLRGEDILPEARILTVADVAEAMASHRPYRPSLGLEAAVKELEAGVASGRYDTAAARTCISLITAPGFSMEGLAPSSM